MKKVLFLIFASLLVLGACGNDDNNSNGKKSNNTETKSVNENKPQFTNDTLVIDQAVLKIDDTFILNDKDSGDKLLAFKYHVKNKSDSEDITSMNVWIACFEATQDSDNTVNKLDVGITPTTGKLGKWNEHSNDTIKKGKTAKGIMTYKLQNDEDVVLKATKGADGKKLGTKTIKLDDLKSEDYSATEDLTDNSKKDDTSENNDSKNVASAKSDDNNSEESKTENDKTTSDSNNSQSTNSNQNNVASASSNSQSGQSTQTNNQTSNTQEIPPTTHDESQMGYGRGDYEAAKEASEKVANDPNAHVGGPIWVGKNESYESWSKRQQEVQNTPSE
ncbi:DUF5067 domain-containing protein [Staphylococcus epidermidis]|uniref:DUF5067 domain-containing protein n=1 Tax=Staphylococcus epidermidis TaxID=1282 RepID=UPI00138B072C|nr:DUF5067 domain-containing protein [Staphylococcus epidermidis]MCG1090180.1 DUF5067 domain-containing protein [Staphylococcus epidermidis]MCG2065929.1 DUF5067 domain-containing protein [Staphylococcus epidermidis]MCG2292754.1 DUF5067 domain-containing protein [Staphylococcus epidermidis]